MMRSNARNVEEYLAALPEDRRAMLTELRRRIRRRLPAGFEECLDFGMIGYVVPLARYPKTYNGHPLMVAALAAQKSYLSLYLMTVYGDREAERRLREGFERAGKRLDMGKSCIRFKSLEDLPLDTIEEAIASVSVEGFIASYEAARSSARGRRADERASRRAVPKRAPAKRAAPKRAAPKRKKVAPKRSRAAAAAR